MSSSIEYAQVVDAVLPREAWDEAYFSLLSLKMHVQSLPGWERFDLWARDLENGDVHVLVITGWAMPDQLSIWLERGQTVDGILRSLEPSPISLNVDLFEEIA